MANIDIPVIVVGITLVGVVLLAAMFFKKRSSENAQNSTSGNKGCSIAFYVFLALLFLAWALAYLYYRARVAVN